MKKSKKFLLTMCTGALATVMVMGNSGVVALAESAKAENVDKSYSQVKGINYSTVEFGDEIVVPKTANYLVNVVDPNGKILTEANGGLVADGENLKVVADKIGHYTVIIYAGDENGTKYSYDVLCTSSREYKLDIADYDIPSYLKVGAENVQLPKAKVYYEEDGEKVYVKDGEADLEIEPVISGVSDVTNIAKENATAYVTYTYDVGTGVYVDAQYKILIQSNFNDEVKPSLSVGSYTETANLNIKYTLPTATAKDAYDERVKVIITVKKDNVDVLKAVVDDKTGYATGTEDAKVEFDNLDNMSFYPTELGDYTITYVAVDDAGNESDPLSYVLTVKDQKGPTINIDRSSIPEKWGYGKVYYEDENEAEVAKDDLKIYLPIPEYYDNNNTVKLAVSLTVKDPEGNQVAKVNDIQKLVDGESFTAADITDGAMGTFVAPTAKEGMAVEFDIAGYVNTAIAKIDSKDIKSEYKYAGAYTVQYTVTDTKTHSTTSSQTYTINVSENYNDDSAIGITASTEVVKNVVLSEGDTFKLPTFVISSSSDGYLNKSYTLKINDVAMDYTDFAGGEEIKLVNDNGAYYLVYEDNKLAVSTGDVLVYEINAEADSGRVATNNEKSTEIVIPDQKINTYTVNANDTLTEITIDVAPEENKYVGVEMGLRSADGEYVSFNATVYYNSILGKKVIKDIEYITPNEDGTYYLEVKVYDIYGTSQVSVYKLDLKAGDSEDNRESEESAFATSTTVGSSITWKYTTIQTGNEFPVSTVEKIATAHKVSGGRFAWMGSEFTPLQENTYTLIDTVVPLDAAGAVVAGYEDVIADKFEMRSEVVASASTAKTIVLDKAMPSYLKRADESVAAIPSAVIYDAEKNFEYTMRVTNPNGVVSNYKSHADLLANFKFDSDGNYTVAYLVNGSTVKSYTIKVGDVTPVSFTVKNTVDTVITKSSGYSFTFEAIEVEGEDDISKLTFKKSIRDAAGNLVGKEYEKTGENGAKEKGASVTLTETGTYTVTYTVIDQSGNESHKKVTIKITSPTTANDIDYTVLSTIIIVVVCLGIAGIIIYYVASSRKKKKNNK